MRKGFWGGAAHFGYAYIFVLGQMFPGGTWWEDSPAQTTLFFAIQVAVYALACVCALRVPRLSRFAVALDVGMALAVSSCMVIDGMGLGRGSEWTWALLLGCAMAWLRLRWFSVWGSYDAKEAVTYLFGGLALGCAIMGAVFLLPAACGLAITAAIPFIAIVSNHMARKGLASRARSGESQSAGPLSKLRSVIIFICACSVMAGVNNVGGLSSQTVAGIPSFALTYIFAAVIAVGVGWAVVRFGSLLDIEYTWKAILLYVFIHFFCLKVFSDHQMALVFVKCFSLAVRGLAVTLMMVVLADVCRHSSWHPLVVFSIGYTVWTCGVSASTLVYGVLSRLEYGIDFFSMAILLVIILLPSMKDFSENRIFADLSKREESPGDVESRCGVLAERYGLTEREHEVMVYLAKGRSRPYIAEALCLSENTIAFHSKNIYAKLGVHSKQALLDMVSSVN